MGHVKKLYHPFIAFTKHQVHIDCFDNFDNFSEYYW